MLVKPTLPIRNLIYRVQLHRSMTYQGSLWTSVRPSHLKDSLIRSFLDKEMVVHYSMLKLWAHFWQMTKASTGKWLSQFSLRKVTFWAAGKMKSNVCQYDATTEHHLLRHLCCCTFKKPRPPFDNKYCPPLSNLSLKLMKNWSFSP